MNTVEPTLAERPQGAKADTRTLQQAMRLLTSGVYVMTSRSEDRLCAATLTWVSQAAFEPPLVMAALRKKSDLYRCLAESGVAALHIVGDNQQDIAWRFLFPPSSGRDGLCGEPFADGVAGVPILNSLPAHLECRLDRIVDTGGDYVVVILRVIDAACGRGVRPLTMATAP
jgi:flavin reductase (DIM6/NTAB) family NADH-FMN oxidoreductase RutF